MITLFHGTTYNNAMAIAQEGITTTHRGFHMCENIDVARQYGSTIVTFELEAIPTCHIGTINKTGDVQTDIKSGIEYVFRTQQHIASLYRELEDEYFTDFRGRKYNA